MFDLIAIGRDEQRLSIDTGNPDLEPAETDSFDLSFEYYDKDAGQFKVGAFYKNIKSLIERNAFVFTDDGVPEQFLAIIPDHPSFVEALENPDVYEYSVEFPTNSEDDSTVWGVELAYERQFTNLPGAWSGLGILTNYTYSDSSKSLAFTWSDSPIVENGIVVDTEDEVIIFDDVPFEGSPEHSGTFGITYNKYGIDANLAYTAQSRRFLEYQPNNLASYEESFETLDLRAAYTLDSEYGTFEFYLEGLDLLRDPEDPNIQRSRGDDDVYITEADYLGGRQFRLGVRAAF